MLAFILITTIFAHNWIHGVSRASKASTVLPAPPRSGPRQPHLQVGQNQEFAVEWATGHPGSYYYFVVLKSTDEDKLNLHNEALLNEYLADAPDSALLYTDYRFQKYHVSCTYYHRNNPGGNRDCAQTSWNPGTVYEKELTSADELYFDREAAWGPTPSRMAHFKYTADKIANDKRAAYLNAKFPWIEAVHKFRVAHRFPREWDLARFSLPARQGSGEYMIHMLWRGYRDVIDIDVLPAPASDVYGKQGQTSTWTKREHCLYPNYSKHSNTECKYFQADQPNNIAACQQYCESRKSGRCTALNVVPLFTPEVVKIAGQTPEPAVPWNKKCRKDRIPSNADENTMVCYTFKAQEPAYDGFNPETEDVWIIRDNDPADPVFYSSCYRRQVKREFEGNVACPLCEEAPASKKSNWQINDRCLSCEDASAASPNNVVKLWKTHEVCEKCF